MVAAHVLAEATEAAMPRPPRSEHGLDLRLPGVAFRRVDWIGNAIGRARIARRGRTGDAGLGDGRRPQPVLQRAERQIDRRGKLGRRHVGVALAQLEHEPPITVRVAVARAALHAAGVPPHELDHLDGDLEELGHGRGRGRGLDTWPARRSRERRQHGLERVLDLVGARARRPRPLENLADARLRHAMRRAQAARCQQDAGDHQRRHRRGWFTDPQRTTSGEPCAGATRGSGVLGAGARVDAAAPTA